MSPTSPGSDCDSESSATSRASRHAQRHRPLEREDALAAIAAGADGVIVSKHGGRQLDGVASAVSKLPAVADALAGRGEVYLDGGVRSGIDLLKALALGANAVMIGRPWVWAVAGAGRRGLVDLLATFKQELEVAMALAGVRQIRDISRDLVERGGT
jgi:L-lactate dehydrogenase (cytochrome)